MDNPLKITATDNRRSKESIDGSKKHSKRREIEAKFDRLWLMEPEHFDPLRNALGRERIERTWQLVESHMSLSGKKAVDLGCGSGVLTRKMRDAGAHVDAVDISNNALKALKAQGIENIAAIQDYVPHTALEDNQYDLVASTELIGYLSTHEQRLYFSELARLVKSEGFVVCSASLDINTEQAVQLFGSLAETEFSITAWKFSYHALYIRINAFFKAPERFAQGWKERTYTKRYGDNKSDSSTHWYRFNSSPGIGWLWNLVQYGTNPIVKWLSNSRTILLGLEKVCKFIQREAGISHAVFIGQLRPLIQPTPEELLAIQPKGKREVWE